jgi:hypothetical protein
LKPERLWLTKTTTGNIVQLYESLKQKTKNESFTPRTIKSAQGSFDRTKNHSGHIGDSVSKMLCFSWCSVLQFSNKLMKPR